MYTTGIKIILNDNDVLDIQADVVGPIGTPFEGGEFRCKLVLSPQFPQVPPKGIPNSIISVGYFMTKIFHPNISEKGEICVNTLKKDWNPQQWSIKYIFEVASQIKSVGYKMSLDCSLSREFAQ